MHAEIDKRIHKHVSPDSVRGKNRVLDQGLLFGPPS